METVASVWQQAAPANDVFLNIPYLRALQAAPPRGMEFRYLVLFDENTPIGVALCQILHFHAGSSMNYSDKPSGWVEKAKRWIADRYETEVLVCGNLLLTGSHGFWFDPSKINRETFFDFLENALSDLASNREKNGLNPSVTLIKDIDPEWICERRALRRKKFAEFQIQPNMVLKLPFKTFDEYLAAMSTKYRTRAKRAFKKGNELERRELQLQDIQEFGPLMHQLYLKLAQHAGFNMVELHPEYFFQAKAHLSNQFRVFGYFLNGQMTAFYTTVLNHKTLDAHFLGYQLDHNHQYQLYLNMLYDIIRIALEQGCEKVVFARTALEIKSSVGAEPQQLFNYVKHHNSLVNLIAGTAIGLMNPVEEWTPRHPFRKETDHKEA